MNTMQHSPLLNGEIKWFSREKGFGFIIPENPGVDVFLHVKVVERCGNPVLPNGQEVRYRQEPASDGRVKATYVEIVR